jgi:hypothetical protein
VNLVRAQNAAKAFFTEIDRRGERWNAAIVELRNWIGKIPHVESTNGPRFHHALTAIRNGTVVRYPTTPLVEILEEHSGILDPFNIFMVEHDWVSAFKGSGDFDVVPAEFDFRLPYPRCCFEFQVNDKRLCFLVIEQPDRESYSLAMNAIVELEAGWTFLDLGLPEVERLRAFASAQVRAACISLDAGVTEDEPVFAPAALKKSRLRDGREPPPNYRVLKLSPRRRRHANVASTDSLSSRQPHSRRGHWRHLSETHRTWIRWSYVGDLSKAFLHKHYKC